MARNLKQINNAENHLIVGSIEVIGDISNSGMKQIKRNVRSLQDSMTAYVGQTTDYWSKLSDDGIITPLEKTMLKKEWETIAQTYTTVMTEAVAQQVTTSREIIAYQAAYNDLRYYLNTTLALFDEMSMDTAISDREEFNEYFATYYQWENLVQVALAVGKIGTLDFTVVDNLNFVGTDDQVVIYKGELYQWVHDHWKKIGTNGYCGLMNSLPSSVEGNFFLASQNFSSNVSLLAPDGKNLVSPEGDILCASQAFDGEYIYEYTNGHWSKVTDTNDYRYIVAMSDYYNLTGRLPAIWQDTIDDLQDQINTKVEHIPEYLGLINIVNNIPTADKDHNGDWFLWNGMGTTYGSVELYKGYVYKVTPNAEGTSYSWQQLNPADTTNAEYYMSCLSDLLQQTDVIGSGTFNTLFANAFFANSASITALKTKTIELSGDDGLIKSEDYIAGGDTKGFLLKSDGTFECVDGTFKGNLIAATGNLESVIIAGQTYIGGDTTFRGNIISGPLILTDQTPTGQTKTCPAGTYYWKINDYIPAESFAAGSINFTKTYGPYNGSYNDIEFRFYSMGIASASHMPTRLKFVLYDEALNPIYTYDSGAVYSDVTMPNDFTIQEYIASGAKTFKIFNLPTSLPSESGTVWNNNGTLKIAP